MRLDSPTALKETENLLLKARGDLAETLRQRDAVDLELKDRRRALSEVSQAVYQRTGDYSDALKAIRATESERDSTRIDFYREIDNRIAILDRFKDLDRSFSEASERVCGLNKQEESLRKAISLTSSLLTEARRSLVDAKTEESEIRRHLSEESERLEKSEKQVSELRKTLDERAIALDAGEKDLERKKARLAEYAKTMGIEITFVPCSVK
jgi:chromosome segregation ATPase